MNGSDKTIYIDSESDEDQSNKTTTNITSADDADAACSSKATSVIRMASQAASLDTKSSPRTSTSNVKLPYNRPPKKLVVKLKKPFVPVIEEEANLHPPENKTDLMTATCNALNVESVSSKHKKIDTGVSDKQNVLLECSEDIPYSPIRQSYTPQLPFNQYHDADEQSEVAPVELLDTKYVPSCSYKLNSGASSSSRRECFNDTGESDCDQPCLDHKSEVIVFEISIEDSKDLQNVENDALWDMNKEDKSQVESKLGNDLIMPGISSHGAASTSLSFTSDHTSTNSTPHDLPNPHCSSSIPYRLPTFHRNDEDYVCTDSNRLSSLECDASTSNPHFSSKYKYTSLELDKKTSYMIIDRCKTTSSTERAPSTDSLNIITDEKMPAKGEISEQESNGDIESSWSHQVSDLV